MNTTSFEEALTKALAFLREKESISYSRDEGSEMLETFLKLAKPEESESFKRLDPFMQGQLLMACSHDNQYYFQQCHPEEKVTIEGLLHQWTSHPDEKNCAALRYRQKKMTAAIQ